MKILPNQSNTTIASSSVNNNIDTSGASFEELLNKLSAKRPAASVQATAPASAATTPLTVSNTAQDEALQNAYDTLDILERMEWMLTTSSGLSDSTRETLGSSLTGLTERLMASRDRLSAHDPLVDIINQIGVTAVVERARLERLGIVHG